MVLSKVIADSIATDPYQKVPKRITTVVVEHPAFLLVELLKNRELSINSTSEYESSTGMYIRSVITSTEWANFFRRNINKGVKLLGEIAISISDAMGESDPVLLNEGDWHVPFYNRGFIRKDDLLLTETLMISGAACYLVSSKASDIKLEKAIAAYNNLRERFELSPFEHQATPLFFNPDEISKWPKGMTHIDKQGNPWAGNLMRFISYKEVLLG